MGSLFGGLFSNVAQNGNADLFSSNSKYKVQHAASTAHPLVKEGSKRKADDGSAAAVPAAPQHVVKKSKKSKTAGAAVPAALDAAGDKATQPKAVPPAVGPEAPQPHGKAAAEAGKAQRGREATAAVAAAVAPAAAAKAQASKAATAAAAAAALDAPPAAAVAKGTDGKKKRKLKQATVGSSDATELRMQSADHKSTGEQQPPSKAKKHKKQRAAPEAAGRVPVAALVSPPAGAGSASSGSDDEGQQQQQQQQQGAAAGPAEDKAAAERDKLQRTVFVGNLATTVKRKALAKLFSRYGAVESVRLRSLPIKQDVKMPRKAAAVSGNVDEGRASAHAYVVFQEMAAAAAALAHNMQEFEGRHIRVDRAAASSRGGREAAGVVYDPARSLFVGNLHVDIEDEDLVQCFMDPSLESRGDPSGGVEAVRVVRDAKTSKGKGIAFVLFKTAQACKAGLLLDGKKLRGRPLRVTRPSRSRLPGGAAGAATEGGKRSGGAVKAAPWQGAVVKGRKGKVASTGGAGGGRSPRDHSRGGGLGEKGEMRRGAGGPLGVRKGAGAVGKAKGGAAGGSKRPAVAARKQRQRSLGGGKGKGQ